MVRGHPDGERFRISRCFGLGRGYLSTVWVGVEAFPRLATKQAAGGPQRRDRRRAETRLVVELAIDGFHHGVRDIKAREIHELEGPHTKARLLPHDRIND